MGELRQQRPQVRDSVQDRGASPAAVVAAPLIAHVVFSFDYGGLENGVVNLINALPRGEFRHAVIALTTVGGIAARIRRSDVEVYALHKPPGMGLKTLYQLFLLLLRLLRPTIAHTRNLSTIECAAIAWLARVPIRVHGEHGWDVFDPEGTRMRFRLLRRTVGRAVDRFVALSSELERWLVDTVQIPAAKVTRICNGVDVKGFRPRLDADQRVVPFLASDGVGRENLIVVGTITRFAEIKDPLNLVRAFITANGDPGGGRLRLVMVGDGVLREQALALLASGLADKAWLPGSRDDVAAILRDLDIFVLASWREGISNTVLEAMATGLPVIATAVGGNVELVDDGVTGTLIAPRDSLALASALGRYVQERELRHERGRQARLRVERDFSFEVMRDRYREMYRQLLEETGCIHKCDAGTAA